jgi:hypothetical protein
LHSEIWALIWSKRPIQLNCAASPDDEERLTSSASCCPSWARNVDILLSRFYDDPFFRVGRQGHEENYLDGYIKASLVIVDTLVADELFGQRRHARAPLAEGFLYA